MLIYEKDNKLNINFENSIEEQPDLQISKSGDKTEVLIDGQPGGSGGSGDTVDVAITINTDNTVTTEATYLQLFNIINEGKKIRALIEKKNQGGSPSIMYEVLDYSYVRPGHGNFCFYIWTSVQTGPKPTPALGTIIFNEDGGSTSYSVTPFTVSS